MLLGEYTCCPNQTYLGCFKMVVSWQRGYAVDNSLFSKFGSLTVCLLSQREYLVVHLYVCCLLPDDPRLVSCQFNSFTLYCYG